MPAENAAPPRAFSWLWNVPQAFSAKRLMPDASAAAYWYGHTEYSIIGKYGCPSSSTAPLLRSIPTEGRAGIPGVRTSRVACARWPSSETALTQTR